MIKFNKFYNQFNILSSLLIISSLLLLIFKGLNFGIDFKGGTLIELRSTDSKINVSSLRDNLNQMNLQSNYVTIKYCPIVIWWKNNLTIRTVVLCIT